MSTDSEIREVFEADISEKSKIVYNKYGIQAFLDRQGLQIKGLYDGLITSEDLKLLQSILEGDNDDR